MRARAWPPLLLLLAVVVSALACAQSNVPTSSAGRGPEQAVGLPEAAAVRGPAGEAQGNGPPPAGQSAGPEGGVATRLDVQGEPLGDGVVVGQPTTIENLTVFPILAADQPDFGRLTSLDAALARGTAEVRELSAGDRSAADGGPGAVVQQQVNDDPVQQAANPAPVQVQRAGPRRSSSWSSAPQIQQVSHPGGGDRVNTLVVDNKGDLPIYILAGTVVKGGNQDRQIGQDVIIPPKAVVPVDAFCVEQGRWTAQRQGAATGGKFSTLSQLATSKVRAAAQYEGKQGKVWEQVAEVNQAHGKRTSSGTLLATLDAPELQRARNGMRGKVLEHLDAASPSGAVVGLAYAVDGKIQGVRWFANHEILTLFRDALANTAAVDAITAQANGSPKSVRTMAAAEVSSFVDTAEREASEKAAKKTAGDNENRYSESGKAFSSKTTLSKPGKPKAVISKDFLAK